MAHRTRLSGSKASARRQQDHVRGPHDLDFFVVVDDDAGDLYELFTRATAAFRGMKVPKDLVLWYRRDVDKWAPVKFSLAHEAVAKGKLLYAA